MWCRNTSKTLRGLSVQGIWHHQGDKRPSFVRRGQQKHFYTNAAPARVPAGVAAKARQHVTAQQEGRDANVQEDQRRESARTFPSAGASLSSLSSTGSNVIPPNSRSPDEIFRTFAGEKSVILCKSDKSGKHSWDDAIIPLTTLLNDSPDYYTLSSCSGRAYLWWAGAGIEVGDNHDGDKVVKQQDDARGASFSSGWPQLFPKKSWTARAQKQKKTKNELDHATSVHDNDEDQVDQTRKDKHKEYPRTMNGTQRQELDEDKRHDLWSKDWRFHICHDYSDWNPQKYLGQSSVEDAAGAGFAPDEKNRVIWARFEPFVLHVACRSLAAAFSLIDAGRAAFPNSALLSWKKRYVVHIPGVDFVDLPYAFGKDRRKKVEKEKMIDTLDVGHQYYSPEVVPPGTSSLVLSCFNHEEKTHFLDYVDHIMGIKFKRNAERTQKFQEAVERMLAREAAQCF
ncbi:unnamed protein product [Amoebophrya sp. A25]|nr:unnamed protein product [Amoebophrya sp. A25]|eukprot:GSA25T00013774001.1